MKRAAKVSRVLIADPRIGSRKHNDSQSPKSVRRDGSDQTIPSGVQRLATSRSIQTRFRKQRFPPGVDAFTGTRGNTERNRAVWLERSAFDRRRKDGHLFAGINGTANIMGAKGKEKEMRKKGQHRSALWRARVEAGRGGRIDSSPNNAGNIAGSKLSRTPPVRNSADPLTLCQLTARNLSLPNRPRPRPSTGNKQTFPI